MHIKDFYPNYSIGYKEYYTKQYNQNRRHPFFLSDLCLLLDRGLLAKRLGLGKGWGLGPWKHFGLRGIGGSNRGCCSWSYRNTHYTVVYFLKFGVKFLRKIFWIHIWELCPYFYSVLFWDICQAQRKTVY